MKENFCFFTHDDFAFSVDTSTQRVYVYVVFRNGMMFVCWLCCFSLSAYSHTHRESQSFSFCTQHIIVQTTKYITCECRSIIAVRARSKQCTQLNLALYKCLRVYADADNMKNIALFGIYQNQPPVLHFGVTDIDACFANNVQKPCVCDSIKQSIECFCSGTSTIIFIGSLHLFFGRTRVMIAFFRKLVILKHLERTYLP